MDFVGAIKAGFKNYVSFRGTATRPEFWYWILFTALVLIVASALDRSGTLGNVFSVATLLPSLAVAVRRLRDAGFSWVWLLLPAAGIPSLSIGLFQFVNELVLAGVTIENLDNPELIDPDTLEALMANETLLGASLLILGSLLYIVITLLVVQVIMPARPTKTFEQGNKRVGPKGPETKAL
jgi:uncharacterized membrane protein YhaH (DUF805 family)